mmetsp:Transcript_5474/g.7074  ORF Transcript_5474/g.7074 Transcript_5474/m.7074 type:complete len:418 (-) Transcript_5474:81-1334(-)
MGDEIKKLCQGVSKNVTEWRRHIHRHPELSKEERETVGFVKERLLGFGFCEGDMRTVAETGLACVLKCDDSKRKCHAILFRADMDALPVQEAGGGPSGAETEHVRLDRERRKDYRSQVDGVSHACGHDGHVAMLLGAASLLIKMKSQLARDVVFCFQPAEENYGGAERMIKEGVMEGVSSVFGIHLMALRPTGNLATCVGPMMAADSTFLVTIKGKGGHAGLPQHTADPIIALGSSIMALQTIISRNIDPLRSAVVTIGKVEAGTTSNVIPTTATIEGTIRCFEKETLQTIEKRVTEILTHTAEGFGCKCDIQFIAGYPAVVNHPAGVAKIEKVGKLIVEKEEHLDLKFDPVPPSEDFSIFLENAPGAFVFLGSRNEKKGITAEHHTPMFDVDEDTLPYGVELFLRLALDNDVVDGV